MHTYFSRFWAIAWSRARACSSTAWGSRPVWPWATATATRKRTDLIAARRTRPAPNLLPGLRGRHSRLPVLRGAVLIRHVRGLQFGRFRAAHLLSALVSVEEGQGQPEIRALVVFADAIAGGVALSEVRQGGGIPLDCGGAYPARGLLLIALHALAAGILTSQV